jgi:hypothetical protein
MHAARTALLTATLCGLSATAFAEQGKVVWTDPSCMYFMAQLDEGFGSYNVREGKLPEEGDIVEGGLKSEGAQQLVNKTSGASLTAIPMALAPRLHPLIHSSPAQCYRRFTNK